jgi:hypothetical protein
MKFNNIAPRPREERAALKDKEKIEEYRLKQRIGGYHKYVDNAMVSQPDPVSSHFISDAERFDKDFASYDKKVREQEHQHKLEVIERKRVEKFERDLNRWKYMDEEEGRDKNRLEYMNEHYLTGKKNKGGSAYNVISLEYDNSKDGQRLKKRDDDAKVRALMRSKNIDMRANCGYNVLTGDQRSGVYVPPHEVYNPYEYNRTQSAGSQIVFGKAAEERYTKGTNDADAYEESKAMPADQNAYSYEPQAYAQPSYAAAPKAAPVAAPRGGVQLPLAARDYSAFGGQEGAGVGVGYSKPLQAEVAAKGFSGGAGTKFY